MKTNRSVRKYFWVAFSLLSCLGFGIVWLAFPHKSEIDSIGQFFIKLFVYFFIILSIGFFPKNLFEKKYLPSILVLPFFFYCGYLIPRLSYYGFTGLAAQNSIDGGEYYTLLYLLLYPSIILLVCFAYRMGGGSAGNAIKISLSGAIILFSGFLDILWYVINPVKIPETIEYAHHIKVVLGHYPRFQEAIIFAIFHLPILITVLLLPLDRWIEKLFPEAD